MANIANPKTHKTTHKSQNLSSQCGARQIQKW